MKRIILLGIALIAIAAYHDNEPVQAMQTKQSIAPYSTWWIQVKPPCGRTNQVENCSRLT